MGSPSTELVTNSQSEPKQGQQPENFPQKVWACLACFRSIQLAIVLLSLLALAVLAGVLLPQEGLVETAQIKKTFGVNYRLMRSMGLFNVYSSYWFISIEVLFFFNLLFGSFQWLKPAFLAATQTFFYTPETIQTSPSHFQVSSEKSAETALAATAETLKKQRYGVKWNEDKTALYATKGNFTRLGPVVAHFGILMLLIFSVYGAFTGFKAQKLAEPGDVFSFEEVDMFKANMNEGIWQGSKPDWKIKVNDFRIEFSPKDSTVVQQYYADLSVLKADGTEQKRETISVNHPLSVGDVTVYQASFLPTGKLKLLVNNQPQTVMADTQFMDKKVAMLPIKGSQNALIAFPFYVQQDPGVKQNYLVCFLKTSKGFLGAGKGKMPSNLKLAVGESGTLGGVKVTYEKPIYATGLQIKKAPEVPMMYLSFCIIVLGAFICIGSQRRLWVAVKQAAVNQEDSQKTSELLIEFRTNKARLSFLKELKSIQNILQQQLSPSRANPADVLEAQQATPSQKEIPSHG